MSIGNKNGNWYCQYRKEGKKSPVKEYFGVGNAGKQKAIDRDLRVKQLKNFCEPIHSDKLALDELGQLYVDDLRIQGRKEEYINFILKKLNVEWLPHLNVVAIDDLKPVHFIRVHDLYVGKAIATQNRYMDYLNILFNYGVTCDYITKNPMAKWWKRVKRREESRTLTIDFDQFKSIWLHAEPHLKWVLEVLWETGVRPGRSELFNLKWDDVDWQKSLIHCRGTKTKASDRYLPITDQFKKRLHEKFGEAQTDYLLEYKGKRLKSVQGSFKSAKENACITQPCCLYHIRHLFASVSLAEGGDPKSVSTLLGGVVTRYPPIMKYT